MKKSESNSENTKKKKLKIFRFKSEIENIPDVIISAESEEEAEKIIEIRNCGGCIHKSDPSFSSEYCSVCVRNPNFNILMSMRIAQIHVKDHYKEAD